ncbi:MAG: hypothetical protein QOD29_438, partial [Alphaproteobacteria bacterium]|nr:hypothetical protein [Alphaproteobacteria bacterium]
MCPTGDFLLKVAARPVQRSQAGTFSSNFDLLDTLFPLGNMGFVYENACKRERARAADFGCRIGLRFADPQPPQSDEDAPGS